MIDKIKQVIVIRRDLNMRRGKEIAQGSHASLAFLINTLNPVAEPSLYEALLSNEVVEWINDGFAKICLQVSSEEELLDIAIKAKDAGIECHIIEDEGLTEFRGVQTKTCLAIGPDYSSKIDAITGDLKLY